MAACLKFTFSTIKGLAQFPMSISLISKIRSRLLTEHPFWGSLGMRLSIVEDAGIETLSTDGNSLYYNPEYLASLSSAEQMGVVAHQIGHCMLGHMFRGGAYAGSEKWQSWNEAADYALNPLLQEAGFQLPKNVLSDPQFKGMYAEQIMSKRAAQKAKQGGQGNKSQNGPGSSQKQGGSSQGTGESSQGKSGTSQPGPGQGQGPVMAGCPTGNFTPAPPTPEEGGKLDEQDWKLATEQAMLAARAAGTLPGGMEIAVKDTMQPKVDWINETRDFVVHNLPSDRTWTNPDRRYVSQGIYLPGPVKNNVGTFVIVVDTSGSTIPILPKFNTEVGGILREARPEKVILMYVDAKVQGVEEVDVDAFDVKLTLKGGGGTRFQPAFNYLEKEGITPEALIYLTDLENSDTVVEPSYPTLWICPKFVTKDAPFGRLVHIEE
jgi:predicted metal-dependent peptidase